MPRYYFDIFNSVISIDDEGVELADDAAAMEQVRMTLPALLKDLKTGRNAAQLRVDVRDDAGRRVASGTILMLIERERGDEVIDGGHGQPSTAPEV